MRVGQARHQRFEALAALGPRQGAQILAVDQQRIVEPHEGRRFGQHLFRHGLATQTLLERVEARRAALCDVVGLASLMRAAHQQFAIENGGEGQCVEQFGEGRRDIVARTREQFRFVPRADQLHPDPIPFPLRDIVREIDHGFFQRMCQHEWAEGRQIRHVGRSLPLGSPGEKLGKRRGEAVPIFLDLLDRHVEGLGERRLGEATGNPDPHATSGELQQRVAARWVEPVEQLGQFDEHGLAVHRFEQVDRLAHAGRGRRMIGGGPQQARRFRRITHEIAAQRPQHRIDAILQKIADGGGFDRRKVQPVGQGCQSPAAVRIGCGAQIFRDQPQFLIAAARVDQRVDEGGEVFHRLSRPRPRSRPWPAPAPVADAAGTTAARHPRGRG